MPKKTNKEKKWFKDLKRFSGQHIAIPHHGSRFVAGYGDSPEEAITTAQNDGFLEVVIIPPGLSKQLSPSCLKQEGDVGCKME